MNTPAPASPQFEIGALIEATAQDGSGDVFQPALSPANWKVLASYLQPLAVRKGQVLIQQNATDRTVYLIESGTLTVHYEDQGGRIRLASVGPGSAVGEGAFFSRQPRNATVQAASDCKLWSLTPMRFSELRNRQPEIAVDVAMALGTLVSRRLANRRVAIT